MTSLPCQTDSTEAVAPLWTLRNPLPEPEPSLRVRPLSGMPLPSLARALFTRPGHGAPLTPPPQPRNCA